MKKLMTKLLQLFSMIAVVLSVVVTIPALAAEVATPSKPTVTNVTNGIRVKWTAVDGVEKYGVWRSETGKNGTYQWQGNPGRNSYHDTDVESGKTYYYKVACVVSGSGANTKFGAKSEAAGVVYVDTPEFTGRYNKAAGITLEWEKITGATGYAVYRKSFAGTDAWVRIGEVASGSTLKWTDTSVKNNNGSVYRYAVRALTGANNKTLSGCYQNGRTMVRLTSRTLNSAEAVSESSVKCSWTTTKEATGYEVRFMVGSEIYKTFTVGNYKTGVKTFTNLEPGTTYKIQVRSYKKVADVGGFYSAWSEAKYATTKEVSTSIEYFDWVADPSSIVSVNGGVVLTRDAEGIYSAYTYDGEKIDLEGTYNYWDLRAGISDEGQFALSDGDVVRVFDKEGNVLLELPAYSWHDWVGQKEVEISISENKVLYHIFEKKEDAWCPGWSIYLYDIVNQTTECLASSQAIYYDTNIHDGMFFVKDTLYNDASCCDIEKYSMDGKRELLRTQFLEDGDYSDDFRFSAAVNDGFLRIWGGGYPSQEWEEVDGEWIENETWVPCSVGLMSADGTKHYIANIDELFQLIYQFDPAEDPEWENWSYSMYNVYEDGIYCGNYQKQVVLELNYKDESVCLLLDFDKAEYVEIASRDLTDWGGQKYYDYEVTNLEDIIVAQYDLIRMSSDGYHLASQEDNWFYIDENGTVVAEYKDCSQFINGHALVIEEDGLAYLVDKEFNKLTNGQPATSVYIMDSAFVIENGDEQTFFIHK